MRLQTTVKPDTITDAVSAAFDYTFTGTSEVEVTDLPPLPKPFCLGLIVGPSGSGKSTLLRSLGNSEVCLWSPDRAVASHFATAEEAMKRLTATGLNSIPTWCRPYQCLSTGEQFRADMARRLESGARIDEFTSVVDRVVARSCSVAIARYARAAQLTDVVLASCHYDIIPWLDADWVYDTATGVFTPRGSVQRPQIKLDLLPCSHEAWAQFSQHHYLSADMNRSARCWLVVWDGTLIGFASALAFPSGNFKNAWREHRTVVLPDFQGMGFGVRISDAVAQMFVDEGARYFSKTAHPRMGEYRERSPLWKPTSKNKRRRADYLASRSTKEAAYKRYHANRHLHAHRLTYSHEYIGSNIEVTCGKD